MQSIKTLIQHNYFILFFIWIILTSININKAYHIDDTFHLQAAEHLVKNPTKPMSGVINWGNNPTPMYEHNQPPLFFYLIAIGIQLFGSNEIALHLLFSIFTFLALLFFKKITEILSISDSKSLLLLFGFSPAIVVNQNLMTDVPILALTLGSLLFILKALNSGRWYHYLISSFCIGLGLLIKYSLLPLVIVLPLVIMIHKDFKKLWVLAIPMGLLIGWSYLNYLEYGSIHMLDRPKSLPRLGHGLAFISCIGAIATFLPIFLFGSYPKKIISNMIYVITAMLILSVVIYYFSAINEAIYEMAYNIVFFINGGLVLFLLFLVLYKQISNNLLNFITSRQFVIFLYLSSLGSFIALFAPFNATRHILLILPFILLFAHSLIKKSSLGMKRLSLGITVTLGLLLGISDWCYADYYRKMASTTSTNNTTKWSSGHWGWQWYTKQNGMKTYSTDYSELTIGDYLIYPGNISKQSINENLTLELIDKKWEEANILTLFSGKNFAAMYNSFRNKPAWSLSKNPIDTIYYYKITGMKNDSLSINQNNLQQGLPLLP